MKGLELRKGTKATIVFHSFYGSDSVFTAWMGKVCEQWDVYILVEGVEFDRHL